MKTNFYAFMNFLAGKFDILLVTGLFLVVFRTWIVTGSPDVKDFARDFVIVIFALLGIRRAAAGIVEGPPQNIKIGSDPPIEISQNEEPKNENPKETN